jgi:hypothetical protein
LGCEQEEGGPWPGASMSSLPSSSAPSIWSGGPRSGGGGPRSGAPATREAEQRHAGDDGRADPSAARTPLLRLRSGNAPSSLDNGDELGRRSRSSYAAPPCSFPRCHLLLRLLLVLLTARAQLPQATRKGKRETATGRPHLHGGNVYIWGSFADALRGALETVLTNSSRSPFCICKQRLVQKGERRKTPPNKSGFPAAAATPCASTAAVGSSDNPPRKIPYYRLNKSTLVIKR